MVIRVGNGNSNFLFGSFGDDELSGRGGNDVLFGGFGDDLIRGGNGNDLMFGGFGNDIIRGGNGNDLAFGGFGNDRMFGGNGDDLMFGGSGNDRMVGGRGSDALFGGSGNDTFVYRAERNVGETDFYSGGSGNDRLVLRLNEDEAGDTAILADIAAFEAFLDDGTGGDFTFDSLGLTVNGIERLTVRAPEVVTPPTNNAPIVDGPVDLGISNENTDIFISFAALIGDASDADGDTLSVTDLTASSGMITVSEEGVTFSPDVDDESDVVFSYQISDGTDAVAQTASLDLLRVNEAPTTSTVELAAIAEDTAASFTSSMLLFNAVDADGDTLTVSNVQSSQGGITLDDSGYVFQPLADFNGLATITYDIFDGEATVAGTATIDITPVNDAPVLEGPVDLGAIDEDTTRFVMFSELSADASDVDGDSLSVRNVEASSGAIVFSDLGFEFTPDADDDSEVTFTYEVSDGILSTAVTATLDLTPVNDAPVAVNDDNGDGFPYLIGPNGRLIDVLANDSDVDGDELTITGFSTEDPFLFVEVRNIDGRDQLYVEGDFLVGPPPDAVFDGDDEPIIIFPDDDDIFPIGGVIEYTISDGTATDTATLLVAPDFFPIDVF